MCTLECPEEMHKKSLYLGAEVFSPSVLVGDTEFLNMLILSTNEFLNVLTILTNPEKYWRLRVVLKHNARHHLNKKPNSGRYVKKRSA